MNLSVNANLTDLVIYLTIYVIFSFEALTNVTYIGTRITEFCKLVIDSENQCKLKMFMNIE